MEQEYFYWEGREILHTAVLFFMGCTMKKTVGVFKEGERVDGIEVDFEHGRMIFNPGPEQIQYKMRLEVQC